MSSASCQPKPIVSSSSGLAVPLLRFLSSARSEMGAQSSAELLAVPLTAQEPMLFTTHEGRPMNTTTRIKVTLNSLSSTMTFVDAVTNKTVFETKTENLGYKTTLSAPDGYKLMSIKVHSTKNYGVFEGADTRNELFQIAVKPRGFSPTVIHADFIDLNTGVQSRLFIEGSPADRVAVICLDRGNPRLPTVSSDQSPLNNRCQAVARIERTSGTFSFETYVIEIVEGVDITVIIMLWVVRYTAYVQSAATMGFNAAG